MFKVSEYHPEYQMFSECHCFFYRLSSSYFLILVMELLTDEIFFVEYWFCPLAKKTFFFSLSYFRNVRELPGFAGSWNIKGKKGKHHLSYVFIDFMTTIVSRKTLLKELLDLNCCSLVTSKCSTPSTELHQSMFKSLTRSDLSIHTSGYIFTQLCMNLNN